MGHIDLLPDGLVNAAVGVSSRLQRFARSRIVPINFAGFRAPVGFEDELRLPWLIGALLTLLCIAVRLFFSGFGVFVFNLTSKLSTCVAK